MLGFIAMESEDKDIRMGAMKKLSKMFGKLKAVNQFFRMYLRARGEPETISSNINENSDVPLGCGDLENPPPKANSPDEARKMAEDRNL